MIVEKAPTAASPVESAMRPLLRALRYLVSECNYGGRVTDEHDRRLLAVMLSHYFGRDVAFTRGHRFSEVESDACYSVPAEPSLSACRQWAADLPESAPPSALGLNEDSACAANERESAALLRHTLATQPQLRFSAAVAAATAAAAEVTSAAGEEGAEMTTQAMLRRVRRDLIAAVPEDLDAARIAEEFPVPGEGKKALPSGGSGSPPSSPSSSTGAAASSSSSTSLNSILRLEVGRYNALLACIRRSLRLIEEALCGHIVMSIEIEATFESVLKDQVHSSNKVFGDWFGISTRFLV